MLRLTGAFLVIVIAAAVLTGTALAKEGGVELSSTPVGKKQGEPWLTTLRLVEGSPELLAQAKPGVRIRHTDSGQEVSYRARPTEDPRVYDVRVVFPKSGLWVVEAFDGITGRSYQIGGQYLIHAPDAAPVTPTGGSSGDEAFPVWPVAGGIAALVLAAAGAALFARRQRFGLSH